MSGSSEDLKSKHVADRFETTPHEGIVLLFRITNACKRRSEAHSAPGIGIIGAPLKTTVLKSEKRAGNGELGVAVQSPNGLGGKKTKRIKVVHLTGTRRFDSLEIESVKFLDAALLRENSLPQLLTSDPDARDGTNPGDDGPAERVRDTHAFRSRSFLNPSKVRGATHPIMKSPMIGSAIGAKSGQRKSSW